MELHCLLVKFYEYKPKVRVEKVFQQFSIESYVVFLMQALS